jgi:hypothetical protein
MVQEASSVTSMSRSWRQRVSPRTALPPDREPLQILMPSDRIGVPCLRCPPGKIIAVVLTNDPDYPAPSRPVDSDLRLIADHLLDFLSRESRRGRLPATLLPLQSGVGNVANAVLARFDSGPFRPLTACAVCRRSAVPSRSSTTARIPITGPRCRTTSTARSPPDPASTPPTCSARRCHGMCATCRKAPCGLPDSLAAFGMARPRGGVPVSPGVPCDGRGYRGP